MKKRIQLTITDDNLKLLDELAEAERLVAKVGEVGYRPVVVHDLLALYVKSGKTADEFVAFLRDMEN